MTVPQKTREYRLPKAGKISNLVQGESTLPALKSNEALLKVHAVSLQYRDLMIAKGQYGLGCACSASEWGGRGWLTRGCSSKENVVPCSDMAGTVAAVGDGVKSFAVGDRVCANFAIDHIAGLHLHLASELLR
jgi:NADPH:quinone reductase-like Zn-dependent oxidoreductase